MLIVTFNDRVAERPAVDQISAMMHRLTVTLLEIERKSVQPSPQYVQGKGLRSRGREETRAESKCKHE